MRSEPDDAVAELRASVRSARRVALLGHALETALVGAAGALVALAACRFEGAENAPAFVASALTAGFAAAAWGLESHPTTARVVARLDARRGLAGALITFTERAREAVVAPVVELLARRLHARALHLARAALRVRAPIVAGALLGAALCAWSFEHVSDRGVTIARAERAAAGVASASRGSKQDAPSGVDERLAALVEEARTALDGARRDPSSAESRLAAVAHDARELQRTLPPSGDRARALAELQRGLASVLRPGASADVPPMGSTDAAGSTPGSYAGAGLASVEAPGAGASSAAIGASAPTRSAGSESANAALQSTPDGSAATSGVASAGPWWDPRYDAVVSHWIEARRTAR
ncbi:MAG: hypothetical protein HZA53_09875 [Planctomycetes bacterium]|nr:hypothetical protein [Planctomycetota bacterium]